MSEPGLRPESIGDKSNESAAESSGFLFKNAESLAHWDDESLELLITEFDAEEHDTRDRLELFTKLFEVQAGSSLSDDELGFLTSKLARAERYLSEQKQYNPELDDEILPRQIRKSIYATFMEEVRGGNKTAGFIDSRLIEQAKQALPMFYRYTLLLLSKEDWPTALED